MLVDDVFIDPDWLDGWLRELAEIEVLLVGVIAPLPVLAQRESTRGDRILGEARAQVDVIQQGIEYDPIVDTSRQSPEDCAHAILAALSPLALLRGHSGTLAQPSVLPLRRRRCPPRTGARLIPWRESARTRR